MVMFRYKKTTDVQRTWKEHGWTPPSEDPKINEKWLFYRTLNTESQPGANHEPTERPV
jgi:hypothetical protein